MKNLRKGLKKHKRNLKKHSKNIWRRCLENYYYWNLSDDWMDDMPMECNSHRYEFLVHVSCFLFAQLMLLLIVNIIGAVRQVNYNEVYRLMGEIIREMLVWK